MACEMKTVLFTKYGFGMEGVLRLSLEFSWLFWNSERESHNSSYENTSNHKRQSTDLQMAALESCKFSIVNEKTVSAWICIYLKISSDDKKIVDLIIRFSFEIIKHQLNVT